MSAQLRQKLFRIPGNIAVSVGLHWDFVGADPVDLDLSAVAFSSEGVLLDVVFFNHPFPVGTDEEALRDCGFLVDPQQLPYMFISGDSRIGGEEENRLPGLALAARRRALQMRGGRDDELKRFGVIESIFSRIYNESELEMVEEVLNDKRGGGHIFDEDGRAFRSENSREMCDESVTFVMHKIPSEAAVIFLVVTSYTGADFSVLPTVKLVVVNEMTNEQVGTIDLKHATGNGTANLACMLCRVPTRLSGSTAPGSANGTITMDGGSRQLWDLRELNIRTFGYTFVDTLPTMMDVLGVEVNSRTNAVWQLPDYSLSKDSYGALRQPLSDVRFGVGWGGDHDLDSFMVFLDEKNNYVDHINPKPVKLQSRFPHTARHSGDAINGYSAVGDEEFIDLVTYRLPLEVHTIIFGVCYVEGGRSTRSIMDVPKFYMRLQNRTAAWPNAIEVDRWNVHEEIKRADEERKRLKEAQLQGSKSADNLPKVSELSSRLLHTYKGADGKMFPVRALVLGMMVKTAEAPLRELYPEACAQKPEGELGEVERRNSSGSPRDSDAQVATEEEDGNAAGADPLPESDTVVSVFQYLPIHEYVPISNAKGFVEMMPYMRCIAKYCRNKPSSNLATRSSADQNINNPLRLQTFQPQLNTQTSMWDQVRASSGVLSYHAVRVQFLEVRHLQPELPHVFKCHGEVWVCEKTPFTEKRSLTVYDQPTFRTPYLMHRQNMQWDESNPATAALLFVREFDRIRVVIYERAAFGYVDIDLMDINELWSQNPQPDLFVPNATQPASLMSATPAQDRWFQLSGGPLSDGLVRLRISRAPIGKLLEESERTIAAAKKKRRDHARAVEEEKHEAARERYSGPCCIM
ncbi:TerD domain containing protein, putative [Trypanosoma equiperdum]|uniref:TerD domain containing protein, putative n=1 Tax=Trypanosoma equiperdum TaxID=5694 RepID=A0A1G4I2G5_TRYEQ|nr:TerD domain containing protein, putative [Trypanosoma equiperdum]